MDMDIHDSYLLRSNVNIRISYFNLFKFPLIPHAPHTPIVNAEKQKQKQKQKQVKQTSTSTFRPATSCHALHLKLT
jgi:hypothetical protein